MSRYVTVASVSYRPTISSDNDMDKLLDEAARFAWRACQFGADIVAFPEVYPHMHVPWNEEGRLAPAAEQLPGSTTARMMAEAKKLGMYIIWPLWERDGDTLYNAAVLIDRQGEIAGVYHKVHPTIGEIENGIMPGTEASVLETDFGKIGMCICFDLNFRDIMTGLKENGAEVIFFSSMYRGGMQVRAWAYELGCYLVSAIGAELGQIVDLTGRQLELSTYEAIIAHRINLSRRLLHMDHNWDKMDDMLEKYGTDVSFDYVTQEACYAIGSEREGLDIEALIDEFGLERREDYFRRCNEVRAKALEEAGLSAEGPGISSDLNFPR